MNILSEIYCDNSVSERDPAGHFRGLQDEAGGRQQVRVQPDEGKPYCAKYLFYCGRLMHPIKEKLWLNFLV